MKDLREPIQLVLNAFTVQDLHRNRGVGRYTFEVYSHIMKLWEEQNELVTNVFSGITVVGAEEPDMQTIFERKFPHTNFVPIAKKVENRNLLKYFYYKFTVTPALTKLFKRFSERTIYFLPRHQILSVPNATYTVTMVHDLAPLVTKRLGKNPLIDPLLNFEYGLYMKELAKSSLIVTNSSDTSLSVSQATHRKNDIRTILLGNAFEHIDIEKLKKKPAPLIEPYFMYYAGYDYNKNIPGIIKAFAAFIRNHEDTNRTKLVFSANKSAEETIIALAKAEGILENIVIAGFITDADMPHYLIHSLGLFRLSFMEGCGLPEIEAMALGVPVISADIGAVREMVGDFAYLVNPHTPLAAEPILYLLAKKRVPAERLKAAQAHARTFTWQRTAEETVQAITEYVQNTKPIK